MADTKTKSPRVRKVKPAKAATPGTPETVVEQTPDEGRTDLSHDHTRDQLHP